MKIDATGLLREVDERLIDLLRDLEPADWQRPAVGQWAVRDVAAHLLDGSLRRLSLDRDRHRPPLPDRDLFDYEELVGYLNELNATWVAASQRLSPSVILDLLEHVCPRVADYFDALDADAEAAFPVSWAGEESSRVWMDIAREFTERWHHQQQIREAVGAPGLDEVRYLRPLLAILMRAVPRSYDAVEAPDGTRVEIRVGDLEEASWTLERVDGKWTFGEGQPQGSTDSEIEIGSEIAWRLLTKGITGSRARSKSKVTGDPSLADPFFETLAVMA